MAFLTGARRTACVVACGPCDFLVLSGRVLQRVLALESITAARLSQNLACLMATRLEQTTARLSALADSLART
jgi:CRP-like cAMP-binding protein